jgi:hypothetical protein
MRKYRPSIRLVLRTDCTAVDDVIKPDHVTIQSILPPNQTALATIADSVDCFHLHGCEFIAVTAYQNQLVSIRLNRFHRCYLAAQNRKRRHYLVFDVSNVIFSKAQVYSGWNKMKQTKQLCSYNVCSAEIA